MTSPLPRLAPVLLLLAAVATAQEPLRYEATVGVPVEVNELVLPGPALEPLPVNDETSVVVRVADVYAHGTAHRYDLVFYGLDPGTYDLGDFLQRTDGTPAEGLPTLTFDVKTLLPAGRVEPNTPVPGEVSQVGGYRLWMGLAAVAWVLGFVAILRSGRRRGALDEHGVLRPRTLADRLRPLVESAMAGQLDEEGRAELELTLIAFWRRRLGLGDLGTLEALAQLKQHEEAGPLIRRLEEWLHRPGQAQVVDVDDLLTPYRSLPAESPEPAAQATS